MVVVGAGVEPATGEKEIQQNIILLLYQLS